MGLDFCSGKEDQIVSKSNVHRPQHLSCFGKAVISLERIGKFDEYLRDRLLSTLILSWQGPFSTSIMHGTYVQCVYNRVNIDVPLMFIPYILRFWQSYLPLMFPWCSCTISFICLADSCILVKYCFVCSLEILELQFLFW